VRMRRKVSGSEEEEEDNNNNIDDDDEKETKINAGTGRTTGEAASFGTICNIEEESWKSCEICAVRNQDSDHHCTVWRV